MKRASFNDPFKGGKGCYHLSSSHLEKQTVFRNDYDFIFGVNSLALLLTLFDVRLIAYCLMDNHLHLLLSGRLEACLGYYDRIVRRIAQYTVGEYGISGILSCEDVDIVAVTNDQQLKKEICYIHRNPYKARISSPLAYRWCSADVYFNNFIQSGRKAGSLSVRERRRVFKTHIPVPEDYEFIDERILNKSFVSYENASSRFRDSLEYFDCLRKFSLESIVESEHGIHESISFSDQELRERIKYVCRNEFHAETHTQLSRKDLLRLCIIVRNRYGALQPQITRLLGVDKEILDSIL